MGIPERHFTFRFKRHLPALQENHTAASGGVLPPETLLFLPLTLQRNATFCSLRCRREKPSRVLAPGRDDR